MACISTHLSHHLRHSLAAIGASQTTLATPSFHFLLRTPIVSLSASRYSSNTPKATTTSFSWNDIVQISQPQPESEDDDLSDLSGFSDKVKFCNRGSERLFDFIPFVVEDLTVGHIHNLFAEHLRKFGNVFTFSENGRSRNSVSLNPSLGTPEDRTRALGDVVRSLGEELIPGFRNELYPVSSSFGGPTLFSLERAAAPYFGIRAYGIHLNGYVEKGGQKYLWVAKRSETKSTYPGMLDHLVAGGLPHGIACGENVVKECEEEAGIPRSISSSAIPVGAVSYMDIDGHRYKRDFLFCYDLKLPETFVPKNEDGEVESFKLIPVTQVANIVRRTYLYKPNCSLVIIDFLFRHGYIRPESFGYLDLLQSLRSGDFAS